jgi:hypothetical protein
LAIFPRGAPVLGCLAAAVILAAPETAAAQRYQVTIDSRPRGAEVTLGNGKRLGKTPIRTRLRAGSHAIIIKRDGYAETADNISVSRTRRKFSYRLEKASIGQLEVAAESGTSLDGAIIYVDGEKAAEFPDTVSVEVGFRQIEVKKDGLETHEEWVTVEADQKVTISVPGTPGGKQEESDLEGEDDLEEEDLEGGGAVAAAGEAEVDAEAELGAAAPTGRARGALVAARVGLDVGGRVFRYRNPQTPNLRPYDAVVPIGRFEIDVYPLGFLSSKILGALGLTAVVGFGAPLTSEADVDGAAVLVDTSWTDYALGARLRLPYSDTMRLAAVGSFGQHKFSFADEGTMVEGQVPDVAYGQIGLGLDLELGRSDRTRVLLGGRFVILDDFGELGERFEVASSLGIGAFARMDIRLTDLFDLVVRGSYQYIDLALEPLGTAFVAEGGTDHLFGGMIGLGIVL